MTTFAQFFEAAERDAAEHDHGKCLVEKGFQVWHTGGGCLSWHKYAKDARAFVYLGSQGDLFDDSDKTYGFDFEFTDDSGEEFQACDWLPDYTKERSHREAAEQAQMWLDAFDIAAQFAENVRACLTESELTEVNRRNASDEYGPGVCASHDFCDANMPMHAAFLKVTGDDPLDHMEGDRAPYFSEMWSRAWDIAKMTKFNLTPRKA